VPFAQTDATTPVKPCAKLPASNVAARFASIAPKYARSVVKLYAPSLKRAFRPGANDASNAASQPVWLGKKPARSVGARRQRRKRWDRTVYGVLEPSREGHVCESGSGVRLRGWCGQCGAGHHSERSNGYRR
jgi:hypothetical protein